MRSEETEAVLPDILSPDFKEKFPELLHHFTEYQPDRAPRLLARISQVGDISKMTLADMCDASQAQAYEFYLLMTQAMRVNYPVCGGVMPWAFKRPWNTIGVQLVDAGGRPTHAYYAVKNAFAPIDIALESGFTVIAPGEELPLTARVLSDGKANIDGGEVIVTVYTPSLKVECEYTAEISEQKREFSFESFLPDEKYTDRCFIISAELRYDGRTLARNTYFKKCTTLLADPEVLKRHRTERCENLTFKNGPWLKDNIENGKRAALEAKAIRRGKTGKYIYYDVRIHNVSDTVAFPVSLEIENEPARFYATDSFFLMKPDEYREIRLVCDGLSLSDNAKIKIDAWNADGVTVYC